MAFDAVSLLRMLGINPDDMLGKVAEIEQIAKHFQERLTAVEEKQDRIIALLENMADEQATVNAEQGLVRLIEHQHNGVAPNGAA